MPLNEFGNAAKPFTNKVSGSLLSLTEQGVQRRRGEMTILLVEFATLYRSVLRYTLR